jgi:hypothetical protein
MVVMVSEGIEKKMEVSMFVSIQKRNWDGTR